MFMVESNRKNKAKFCSRECSSRNIGKRKQKYVLKTTICPICKKEFTFKSRKNRKDKIYCSAQCRAKGVGLNRKKVSSENV